MGDHIDDIFKSFSVKQENSKNSKDSQEEIRKKKRERNPLYQNWIEVFPNERALNVLDNPQNIQSNSRKIRRTLNNEEEFQKSLRDHKSETYDAIIVDLLELNRQKIDKSKKYSENIDEYFKSKTGQYLFDRTNEDHDDFTKFIDNDKFFKYYEYGYHSKETEKSFDLKIDKKFLNIFKEIIYDNLEQHNFNLNSKEICESPNNYEIVDSIHDRQLMKKKTRTL